MVTAGTCFVPAVFKTLKDLGRQEKKEMKLGVDWHVICDLLAMIFQIIGLIFWPLASRQLGADFVWFFIIGLLMTSFGWWETFVDEHSIDPISKLVLTRHNKNES